MSFLHYPTIYVLWLLLLTWFNFNLSIEITYPFLNFNGANFNPNTRHFIHENAPENIICEMTAILSRGRWVKHSHHDRDGWVYRLSLWPHHPTLMCAWNSLAYEEVLYEWIKENQIKPQSAGIILCMQPANEKRCYFVMLSLINKMIHESVCNKFILVQQ